MVEKNIQLTHTVSSYSNSKDSLLIELKNTQKELGIKTSKLNQASIIISQLKDTITMVLPENPTPTLNNPNPKECDFYVEKIVNEQTFITVERIGKNLIVIPDIHNNQYIYWWDERVYVNSNKGFFRRVFTWDWKKKTIVWHDVHNSNPLVEVTDTRFIKIKK